MDTSVPETTPIKKTRTYPEAIPKLLDYQALKHYYGLFQSTISKLVMHGKFCNIVKVGRKNYFRKEDVEAWIDAQTVVVA